MPHAYLSSSLSRGRRVSTGAWIAFFHAQLSQMTLMVGRVKSSLWTFLLCTLFFCSLHTTHLKSHPRNIAATGAARMKSSEGTFFFTGETIASFLNALAILFDLWLSHVFLWLRPFIAPQQGWRSRPSEYLPLVEPVRLFESPVVLPPLRPAACFCLSYGLKVPSSHLRM